MSDCLLLAFHNPYIRHIILEDIIARIAWDFKFSSMGVFLVNYKFYFYHFTMF